MRPHPGPSFLCLDRIYSNRHLGENTTASQIAYALKIVPLLGVTSGLAKAITL